MFTASLLYRNEYQTTEALQQIRPAGVVGGGEPQQTAKDALTWQERPPTPEVIKPFQHYARQPAGAPLRHFGTARDAVPLGPFGAKTKGGQESAAECMAVYPDSEVARWKLERSEDVYASTRQEPLGHTFSRGYKIPAELGTQVAFGRPLHVREQEQQNSTQTIIFPQRPSDDEANPATHRMYVQSHGSFAPGEQRKRDYDWSRAAIDPTSHRFGRVDRKGQQCSVKQILQPDLDEGPRAAKAPAVVSQLHDAHKATAGDALGRPRLLGAGPSGTAQLPPDHVFGRPSQREPEPCVGQLLRGCYSPQEQQPDPDLGKSLREGWRNTPVAGRSFGVPSVRVDVPAPPEGSRSVASTINYGNEPTAQQLLAPPACTDLGVREEQLLAPRGRAELAELVAAAGIAMEDDEFEAVCLLAEQLDGAAAGRNGVRQQQQQQQQGTCSLDGFMRARRHYLSQQMGLEG